MNVQHFTLSIMTAAALTVAATAQAQSAYTISEVASGNCAPASINDSGDVAGTCDATATVWRAGSPVALGRLPNGTYSEAMWINAAGNTAGEGDLGDSRPHLLLFRSGSIVNVDPAAPNSHAVRITGSGVVVGNALKGFGTCNSWVAAIYVEDPSKPGTFKRTDLQPAPGGDGKVRCEFATGANESLQVVGTMQNSLFGHLGAFWNNDAKHTLTLLQPYPGDFFSNAYGINALGQAIGDSQGGPDVVNRPVMWDADAAHTPINLPLLPGDNYGTTTAINASAQVIGQSALVVPTSSGYVYGASHFVLWSAGTVTDLQSLIDPAAGWTITGLFGINDAGQIVGIGTHNGQSAAFVMTPQ